jgi:phage tail sheath protein FI
MATYLTPGVYVEEIPSPNKPIEGVSTSTAAFIGLAPGGPLNEPVEIVNWSQFCSVFSDPEDLEPGPFLRGAYLAHAVRGFFTNGGTICWVLRVGAEGEPQVALPAVVGGKGVAGGEQAPGADGEGTTAENAKPTAFKATALPAAGADVRLELTLDPPEPQALSSGQGGADDAPQPAAGTYTLLVSSGSVHERYPNKKASELSEAVKEESTLIKLEVPEGGEKLQPVPGTYNLSAPAIAVEKVSSKEISVKAQEEIEGNEAKRSGLGGLAGIEDISIVCVPDAITIAKEDDVLLRTIQTSVMDHCELMADRVAILDTPPDLEPGQARDWRMYTAGYSSKQATLYWPWLEVIDPLSKLPTLVPPCGHMAGVWARTDATRGVHKAPANEGVMGTTGLGYRLTDSQQGELNRCGLNCIRAFPGAGIKVWGARTLSNDPEWRYLNVRRLFNYISDSIRQGTLWAVFEPNDERLWMQLQIAVSNFLTMSWRSGALFGSTPDKAFFVKCDSETNPPEVRDAGQVVTEIGIAPVKPAEFVIFRISQYTAGEGSS